MLIWSAEWKQSQLDLLQEQWQDCGDCSLSQARNYVVFGDGNPDADILFIGEAPGKDEDKSGRPFVGEGGKLFNALLTLAKLSRGSVYVANMVGCRPPDNRDPNSAERDACLPRLFEIIYLVDPLLIVPVGKFALKSLAKGRDWGITTEHGKVFSSPNPAHKLTGDRNSMEVPGRVFPRTADDKKKHHLEYDMIPIVHPAFILREDSFDTENKKFQKGGWAEKTLADLKFIVQYVESLKKHYESIPQFTRS